LTLEFGVRISSSFYFHIRIEVSFVVDIDETTDKDLMKLLAK